MKGPLSEISMGLLLAAPVATEDSRVVASRDSAALMIRSMVSAASLAGE